MEEAINVLKSESSSDPSVSVDIAKLWDCRQDVFQDEVEDVTVRRDNIKEGGEIKSVRRVFVNKPQAKEYSNVGWVVNGDVEACMLCSTEFSFFNGRHHCRVCGCVSCRDCSSGELIISEFREYGPVRACDHCFCGQVVQCWMFCLTHSQQLTFLVYFTGRGIRIAALSSAGSFVISRWSHRLESRWEEESRNRTRWK